MDALLEMVCSVFRDFVDGKADSMKLECAVDAYTRIVEATPVCAVIDFRDDDDDDDEYGTDADDEGSDEPDAGDDDEVEVDDDVIEPNVDVDTSGDSRGEAVELIVGSKVVEKIDEEEAQGEADVDDDAPEEASDLDEEYDVMDEYRDL